MMPALLSTGSSRLKRLQVLLLFLRTLGRHWRMCSNLLSLTQESPNIWSEPESGHLSNGVRLLSVDQDDNGLAVVVEVEEE